MTLQIWILLAGLVWHLTPLVDAAADITLDFVRIGGGGYMEAATPTSYVIKTTHTQVVSSGDIVYTFDTALFGSSKGPACAAQVNVGAVTFTCTTNAGGTALIASHASGSVQNGVELTLIVTEAISGDLATLPGGAGAVSMSTLTANGGTDTLNGGAAIVFYVVPAATITLTRANMNAGTTPTSVQVVFKTPFSMVSGTDSIKLVFSKAVLVSGQSTGLTMTGATFSSYSTSDTQTFSGALSSNVNADASIDMTLASPLMAPLPNTGGAVTVTISLSQGGVLFLPTHLAQTGFGSIVQIGGAMGAGSDPFTHFGNITRGFELPLYTLTPLLKAPDLLIYGSVFPGNPTEQWFDRIVFSTPDESRWMEVKVKKDLENVNISKVPEFVFSTLDVSMGYGSILEPLVKTSVHAIGQKIPFSFLGQEIVFRKMHRSHNVRFAVAGGLRRECVVMAGSSLHLYLCSAPAHEYHGPLHHLSLRYMHLDLAVLEAMNLDELTGLLPELWGVQQMSETTRAYLKEEESHQMSSVQFKEENTSTVWVGGIGMENLTTSCLEQNETPLTVSA